MGTLTEKVLQVCEDVAARLGPGPAKDQTERIRAKLRSPLRVTVAGGVSSGKSTLVNALLGQQIAPVDAGECTQVVTELRWDPHERVDVCLRGGEVVTMALRGGRLPETLPAAVADVERLEVSLSNATLRNLTLVDTPGLDTVTSAGEETEAYLGVSERTGAETAAAMAEADALVFLLPHLRRTDADVLARYRDLYRGSALTSANALGVLSRIDHLSRDADPLTVAAPIAARMTGELRGLVSEVIPVIGLLAETANAATFTEDDARAVAICAEVTDELDREDMTLSAEDFVRYDGMDLDTAQRRRLLDLLDLHGLAVAIRAVDDGRRGAGAILTALHAASGFGRLRDAITGRFAAGSDLFKAHAAICDLQRLSYLRTDSHERRVLAQLRSPLERIELDPEMGRLAVLDVLQASASGDMDLPADLEADLEPLATGKDATARLGGVSSASAAERAAERAAAWARWGGDPRRSPEERRRARAVRGAFEVLWHEASGRQPA